MTTIKMTASVTAEAGSRKAVHEEKLDEQRADSQSGNNQVERKIQLFLFLKYAVIFQTDRLTCCRLLNPPIYMSENLIMELFFFKSCRLKQLNGVLQSIFRCLQLYFAFADGKDAREGIPCDCVHAIDLIVVKRKLFAVNNFHCERLEDLTDGFVHDISVGHCRLIIAEDRADNADVADAEVFDHGISIPIQQPDVASA